MVPLNNFLSQANWFQSISTNRTTNIYFHELYITLGRGYRANASNANESELPNDLSLYTQTQPSAMHVEFNDNDLELVARLPCDALI